MVESTCNYRLQNLAVTIIPLLHRYRQLWANYRNDYSLPLIILIKTDTLIKSENLEIKNKIIKTLQKWIISYKVFYVHSMFISKCSFSDWKKGLSKCFTSSILSNKYDVSRRYCKILDYVITIFNKCLKFPFVN